MGLTPDPLNHPAGSDPDFGHGRKMFKENHKQPHNFLPRLIPKTSLAMTSDSVESKSSFNQAVAQTIRGWPLKVRVWSRLDVWRVSSMTSHSIKPEVHRTPVLVPVHSTTVWFGLPCHVRSLCPVGVIWYLWSIKTLIILPKPGKVWLYRHPGWWIMSTCHVLPMRVRTLQFWQIVHIFQQHIFLKYIWREQQAKETTPSSNKFGSSWSLLEFKGASTT